MDSKRLLIILAVTMGILFLWMMFFNKPPKDTKLAGVSPQYNASLTGSTQPPAPKSLVPGKEKAPQKEPQPGKDEKEKSVEKTPDGKDKAKPDDEPAADQPQTIKKERPKEDWVVLKNGDLFEATFTTYGASLKKWLLLKKKYLVTDPKTKIQKPINLVSTWLEEYLPLRIKLAKSLAKTEAPQTYTIDKKGETFVEFSWQSSAGLKVVRRYEIVPEKYILNVSVKLINTTDKEIEEQLALNFQGWRDPAVYKDSSFLNPIVEYLNYVGLAGDKFERVEKLTEVIEKKLSGHCNFTGLDTRYFLNAIFNRQSVMTQCSYMIDPHFVLKTDMILPLEKIAPKGEKTYALEVFMGPKRLDILKKENIGLERSVDLNLWGLPFKYISIPMLWLLNFFFGLFKNYGIAIILLTIIVKILMLPWTHKSFKSMKDMQKLKPEMDKLKEKYGSDKQKLNQEIMDLYKKNGVNPFKGCLPMIIQMPIWIALYRTLYCVEELFRAPFMLWITDLSEKDNYYIMPILLGISMFIQQKMSPSASDEMQAKIMLYFMPALFTVFMLFLPSGLTLYIFVNTILSIAQQVYINKKDDQKKA